MVRTIVIEDHDEFDARHGGSPILVGGRWLYPDGAMSSTDGLGIRTEPPTDPWKALELQRWYYSEAAKQAAKQFHRVQAEFSDQANMAQRFANLPPPRTDAPQILLHLKGIVLKHRAELAAINERLKDSPTARAERMRQEFEDRRRSGVYEQISQINGISL